MDDPDEQVTLSFDTLMQKYEQNQAAYNAPSVGAVVGEGEEADHVELYQMMKNHWLVCDQESRPRLDMADGALRLGLRATTDPTDDQIFLYRDGEQTYTGMVAICMAFKKMNQLLMWIFWKLSTITSQEYYYYDGQVERSLVSAEQGHDQLGNIKQVKRMLHDALIYVKHGLVYQFKYAHANHLKLYQNTDVGLEFILSHYHIPAQAERAKRTSTPLQEILLWVQRVFLENRLVLWGDKVMQPKRIPVLERVVDAGESVCEVCGQRESEHLWPTHHETSYNNHVFCAKTVPVTEGAFANTMVNTNSYVELEFIHGKHIYESKLEHFIACICQSDGSDSRYWKLLTSGRAQVHKEAEKHFLGNRSDNFVQFLRPCEFAHSFRNGMLVLYNEDVGETSRPVFYPYKCTGCHLAGHPCRCMAAAFPRHIVAQKFFDIYYPFEKLLEIHQEESLDEDGMVDYARLEGDHFFKKIFLDQGIDEETYNFILALAFGRPQFPVNFLEKYQIAIHFRGEGQTGKSVLAWALMQMFPSGSVGIINNSGQEKFILGDLVRTSRRSPNNRVVVCTEADNSLAINRTQFCAMAAGDGMTVTIKGGTSVRIDKWMSQVILFGNTQLFVGKDEKGSVYRRMLQISFDRMVPHDELDGLLQERIYQELPIILTKSMGLYLDMVQKYKGKGGFWKFCPQYFRDERQKSRLQTNLMLKFLNDLPGVLMVHPDAYISKTKFFDYFDDSCSGQESHKYRDKLVESAAMLGLDVRIAKDNRDNPDNNFMDTKSDDWVVGIGRQGDFINLKDVRYVENDEGEGASSSTDARQDRAAMSDLKRQVAALNETARALGVKVIVVDEGGQSSAAGFQSPGDPYGLGGY